VVEIQGIPFCEGCAREQEAYFAIGTLTQEAQGLSNEPLVEAPRPAEKGKVIAQDKSTSAESRLTRVDIASARPSSKEEYERILEWWEGYDPGMDADLLSNLLSRAESNSLRPLLRPRSL
jgi:hypothetical protein